MEDCEMQYADVDSERAMQQRLDALRLLVCDLLERNQELRNSLSQMRLGVAISEREPVESPS
jgi:hypothetical protein